MSYNKSIVCREPVLFQKCYRGLNLRVHVVSDAVFVSAITSNAVDYRYASTTQHTSWKLPNKIAQECKQIAQFLQLTLCGIDLIFFQNQYYILEVNPMPGFDYFCQAMSQTGIYTGLTCCLQQRDVQ